MTQEEKRKKEIAILKASNEMLESTRMEALRRGNDEEAEMISTAKEENKIMLSKIGASEEELNKVKYSAPEKKFVEEYEKKYGKKDNIENEDNREYENSEYIPDSIMSDIEVDDDVQYDVLPLPSKGEPYKLKNGRIPVSFLTASDENIITSPNLYRDGKIVDILLRRKIIDKSIDPNMLCKGDRDAIMIWLRATGYGPEFPLTIHDTESDTDFDTVIDLSKLKMKEFNLKSDENGNFEYRTNGGDLIKFKFLNRYDEIELDRLINEDNLNIKKFKVNRALSELKNEIENDGSVGKSERTKLLGSVSLIDNWAKNIRTNNYSEYEKSITNTMILSIVSINGTSDRDYIKKYVNKMPSFEAFKFRKYIVNNEPGMDLNITVERPENLGGGSIDTFLTIEPSIFINIA